MVFLLPRSFLLASPPNLHCQRSTARALVNFVIKATECSAIRADFFCHFGHLCQNLTQGLDTCLVEPASFGPCFVSSFFTLMGWMHNISLLALSILCWLPVLQSVVQEEAEPGPKPSVSIWKAPEGPAAAPAFSLERLRIQGRNMEERKPANSKKTRTSGVVKSPAGVSVRRVKEANGDLGAGNNL